MKFCVTQLCVKLRGRGGGGGGGGWPRGGGANLKTRAPHNFVGKNCKRFQRTIRMSQMRIWPPAGLSGESLLICYFERRLEGFLKFPGLEMTASISYASPKQPAGQGDMSGDFRVCPDAYWAWDLRQIAVLLFPYCCL